MTLDEYEPLATVENVSEIKRKQKRNRKRANRKANKQHLLLLQTVIALIPLMIGLFAYGSLNLILVVIAITLFVIEVPVAVIYANLYLQIYKSKQTYKRSKRIKKSIR